MPRAISLTLQSADPNAAGPDRGRLAIPGGVKRYLRAWSVPREPANLKAPARDLGSMRHCKPTVRHGSALAITRWDDRSENAEPERTSSYRAAQVSMRILELENRCTGNRTVGSNPTLSATTR